MVAPAVIAAVGSVLGGLFGKPKTTSSGQNAYSHVKGIVQAAKDFSFNPLTLLGAVSPVGPSSVPNPMGEAIANAAAIAAGAVDQGRMRAAQVDEFAARNRVLQEKVDRLTLRPIVPGVYQNGGGVSAPRYDALDPVPAVRDRGARLPGLTYPDGRGTNTVPLQDAPSLAVSTTPRGLRYSVPVWPDGERVDLWDYPQYYGSLAGAALRAQAKAAGVNPANPLNLLWAPWWPGSALNPKKGGASGSWDAPRKARPNPFGYLAEEDRR